MPQAVASYKWTYADVKVSVNVIIYHKPAFFLLIARRDEDSVGLGALMVSEKLTMPWAFHPPPSPTQ
jgi:hypothetical protein